MGANTPLCPIKIKFDLFQITQSGIQICVSNEMTDMVKWHQHDIGHLASSRPKSILPRYVHFSGTSRNKNTKENLAPPLCERWLAGLTK